MAQSSPLAYSLALWNQRRYSVLAMTATRLAKLRVGLMETNTRTQSRARIDKQTVADYAESMLKGVKFPGRGRLQQRKLRSMEHRQR